MAVEYSVGNLGFDWVNQLIEIASPQNTLSMQDLLDAIREAEATDVGIHNPKIASASGKEELSDGVNVGMTVNLLDWQIHFWPGGTGGYIAKIAGGNLVGGLAGDPVAYTEGVQVLLVQSAASTVVTTSTGSGLSPEQDAKLTAIDGNTTAIPSEVWGKIVESGLSAEEIVKVMASALAGKASGAGTGTVKFKGLDGSTDRIISNVDGTGNRLSVAVDGG